MYWWHNVLFSKRHPRHRKEMAQFSYLSHALSGRSIYFVIYPYCNSACSILYCVFVQFFASYTYLYIYISIYIYIYVHLFLIFIRFAHSLLSIHHLSIHWPIHYLSVYSSYHIPWSVLHVFIFFLYIWFYLSIHLLYTSGCLLYSCLSSMFTL